MIYRKPTEARVREEIKKAESSAMLMLGNAFLVDIPKQVFTFEYMANLRRLDISSNCVKILPPAISVLANLREFWVQNNPILAIPSDIQHLRKLEILDIRSTSISSIPTEAANLDNIVEIDWRDTPFEVKLQRESKIGTNDIVKLREVLRSMNNRKLLEESLFEYLYGEHFIMDADKPNVKEIIKELVQRLSAEFDDLLDFKTYVKRAGKLLPESIYGINSSTYSKSKSMFYQMKRDTDRQRMGADVEIKIRGKYFDRIEREEVTALLDSIYKHVTSLEDIIFLVKYATQVLPPNPEEANGQVVWANIVTLQKELTSQRDDAVSALASAVSALYTEQLPEVIYAKALEVAKTLQIERFCTKREITKMTQLTAECAKIFPPDFASASVEYVTRQANNLVFNQQ